jgi:aminoglycoside phosphotransferase (APT) family kinase protein
MGGGMSAEMVGMEIRLADGQTRRVSARFPSSYMRELYADAAEQEFRVLMAIQNLNIPTPEPLYLAGSSDDRFFLMEYLPGRPTANPEDSDSFLRGMAETLATIHRLPLVPDLDALLLETKSVFRSSRTELNESLREPEVIRALIDYGEIDIARPVLRHGDFWPGNVLWHEEKVSGVVDWENALKGPALADLGIARLDIAWILGWQAMERFTAEFLQLSPQSIEDLPYWDLRAALRPMSNLEEWVAPYAALDRPDIDATHLRDVLMDFVEFGLERIAGQVRQ